MFNRGIRICMLILLFILVGIGSGLALAQLLPEYGLVLKGMQGPKTFHPPDIGMPSPTRSARQSPGDIAFVGNGDIYTVTLDGKQVRRLTTDGRNAFPIWSPDGKQIAFSKAGKPSPSGIYSSASLWLITADGKYSRLLMSSPLNNAIYPIAWLPNRRGILAARHYLESDVTATLEIVTLDGWPSAISLKWTEAGKKAGFMQQFSDKTCFTPGEAGDVSRDGKELVFTAATTGFVDIPRMDLYRMDINGTKLRRLTVMPVSHAKCLRRHPKSGKILTAEDGFAGHGEETGVWLRDADGRRVRKLADLPYASHSAIDWSPSGEYIIYQVPDKEHPRFEHPADFRMLSAHNSIWVMRANGTGKYKLADNACHPNWR